MTSSGKGKERKSVYRMNVLHSGTSVDGLSLKTQFGTRVDGVPQKMATSGAHTAAGVHYSHSAGHLRVGEGVTPSYANQVYILDCGCDGAGYPDTRFDLRFLIKHTMF